MLRCSLTSQSNVSANRMQSDGGFETAAPCKGNGISAQGKVNVVNGTLGPPMSRV